jgi:hypothetical protein
MGSTSVRRFSSLRISRPIVVVVGDRCPSLVTFAGTAGIEFVTGHCGDAGLARLKRSKVPT